MVVQENDGLDVENDRRDDSRKIIEFDRQMMDVSLRFVGFISCFHLTRFMQSWLSAAAMLMDEKHHLRVKRSG